MRLFANHQVNHPRTWWLRREERVHLKRSTNLYAERPTHKAHTVRHERYSITRRGRYYASHDWHVLSRIEACVMGHNLAKASASRSSPGKNMRADCAAAQSCPGLGPHVVYLFHSGPGEVGGDLSPAY